VLRRLASNRKKIGHGGKTKKSLLVFLILVSLCCSRAVYAESKDESISSQDIWDRSIKNLDKTGVTQPMDSIYREISRGEDLSWRDILSDILQGKGIDFARLAKVFTSSFAGDLFSHIRLIGKIMLIAVCVACMQILTDTIAPSGTSQIAIWASHMALVVLGIYVFRDVLTIARESMEVLRSAFFAFVPALSSLSLVSGAPVTASILHPLVFGMGSVVSIFVLDVAFPLIYTSVAVEMAGNLGGGDRAYGVASLLRQFAFIGIGLLMSVFVGVVTAQKAASGVVDGAAYRTAKYVSSTFIPVAGKAISDTMDMFFCSTYTLKSALGIAGSIALFGAVFSPLVRIMSCYLVWKLSLAFLGPISGKNVERSLKCMADGIASLAMSIFVTAFVFIICLSLIASAMRPY
jgi:stage III sporulation protein AE